jgi:hypothetical protein
MGRKPVLGLAGLFLASVTLTGCESTDWCCWGKKAPDMPPTQRTQTQTQLRQDQVQPSWNNDPASRLPVSNTTPRVETTTGLPTDPGAGLTPVTTSPQSGVKKSVGAQEESEINPPPVPQGLGKKPVDDLDMVQPVTPAKQPLETTPKFDPPTNAAPKLEEPLPSLDSPPPPSPVPDGATKSSSKYQSTTPSLDDPPLVPSGVPAIPGKGR